ncbi:hypothetical protein [Ornithinimicrobium pratense]|uniref:hypothetical protein n=1 Tax=Ornithinimicrobium pratense TaxID=2593973 RepID=UPI001787C22B|nr:hypothetical protein [Ornithinimicrobium pratense]
MLDDVHERVHRRAELGEHRALVLEVAIESLLHPVAQVDAIQRMGKRHGGSASWLGDA